LPTTIAIRQRIVSDDTVLADPTQVHQVLMNLAANAQHAMRESGGELEVDLTSEDLDPALAARHPHLGPGRYLRLRVRDTGTGIAPELRERIFDPFFTTKSDGSGMGLSVVQGNVQDAGGVIVVDSAPGQGSTFDVFLPVIRVDAETAPASAPSLLRTGSERILFVDDEAIQVDVNQQMLSRLGYQVAAFSDSLAAYDHFRRAPEAFDLVITDMTMPGMTGDILARRILEQRPDLPVILCTGYSETMTREKAEAIGIRGFVLKPVILRELDKILRQVLDGQE
jgi:CheY-like chemotaxis protein